MDIRDISIVLVIFLIIGYQQSLYSIRALPALGESKMVTWSNFLDQVINKLGSIATALISELRVDILSTESGTADVINTGATTSPVTILSPATGHQIDLRGVYLASDSSSGTVTAGFQTGNTIVGRIYCSKFNAIALQPIHISGSIDVGLQISWIGTDTGSEIFYAIRYKEI